jgi:hypothetical protein
LLLLARVLKGWWSNKITLSFKNFDGYFARIGIIPTGNRELNSRRGRCYFTKGTLLLQEYSTKGIKISMFHSRDNVLLQ